MPGVGGARGASPGGPITEGDLWKILPLDARMKEEWVTGKELRSYLESELDLVFSPDQWKLSEGWGPRASGMPLRDDAKCSLAGCERDGDA